MKKYSVFIICVIGSVGIFLLLNRAQAHKKGYYHIAVLTPVSHPALDAITAGFKETLSPQLACTFDLYNAHGDRTLLRTQAEHIVHENYDLVLAIATYPCLIMKEVLAQRGRMIPVIGAAVVDPVGHGLVASLHNSGNSFTTVLENQNIDRYRHEIAALKCFLPQIQKLLLVYSPNITLDREKQLLERACHEVGIMLTSIPVYVQHELAQKVGVSIAGHDCVIILKDTMVVSCIETLITVCNRAHVPLCASDLDSLKAGATCAHGEHEYDFGVCAAHSAYAILHDHKKPHEIPSDGPQEYHFEINKQACAELGISIPQENT